MPDADDSASGVVDNVAIDPVAIQFDQAEFTAPTTDGPNCGVCQRSIESEYYEMGGKVYCPSCRRGVEAALRGGSRTARVLKALIFGSVASAVGAVLYYVISQATGYNIGLVAVVVGVMVGRAVRKGTGNRGGRFYQVLAVFLTYSAIVAMYVPMVLNEFNKRAQIQQPAEPKVAKADKDGVAPDAASKVDGARKGSPSAPKVDGQANPAAASEPPAKDKAAMPAAKSPAASNPGAAEIMEAQPVNHPAVIALTLLVGTIFWIGIFYTIPVYVAIAAPISGLIFAFALWEAWKANRRVHLLFNGPFRVTTMGSSVPEPEAERDGE